MPDQTPPDVEAIRAELAAMAGRPWTAEAAEYFIGRLLDENARLNAKVDSLIAHNGVLVTEIYHQAARADAFREERDALVVQHQADLAARRTAEEHLRRDVVETDDERAVLAAKVEELEAQIEAGRRVEKGEPCPECGGTVSPWRDVRGKVGFHACTTCTWPLPGPDGTPRTAPGMPHPPAEAVAAKIAEIQSDLKALESRRNAPPETSREYLQRMGAEFRSNMARIKARDETEAERGHLASQEPVSGPETPGAGSSRGTGVTEAPGTARAGEPWIPCLNGDECPHRPEWTCPEHGECRSCECGCNTYVSDIEDPDLTLIPGDMVVRDPAIYSGRPTMRGTRILASRIAGELAAGTTWEQLREWYPSLPSLPVPSTGEPTDET